MNGFRIFRGIKESYGFLIFYYFQSAKPEQVDFSIERKIILLFPVKCTSMWKSQIVSPDLTNPVLGPLSRDNSNDLTNGPTIGILQGS